MKTKVWANLAIDSWALALEASSVVAMRMSRLALCDAGALTEAQLMIREKIEAAAQLQLMALTGELGGTAHGAAGKSLAHYRKAVRKKLSTPFHPQ